MVELNLARLQTAVFLTSLDTTRKLDLALTIRQASDELLDADPLMLPIPSHAPLDMPRLQIKSGDGYWTCQVTGNRLDLIFEIPNDKLGIAESAQTIHRQAQILSSLWEDLQRNFGAAANRMGLVSRFVGPLDNAVEVLRERFLLASNAPEPHELQLHVLHKMTLGDTPVNRWTRCFSAASSPLPGTQGWIQVEIDVNTMPDHPFTVTPSSLTDFATMVEHLVLDTPMSLFHEDSDTLEVF